ncbi:hypothetical protein OV207_35065 [Corallococcus sp. BB11-1]|uniref:hypothetical protein n=1 Tax=Corallococcus sp. BB11-1 TaxID=2996783 RepID=UPI002271CE7C|nr:hypothetical protein [Corallococcus sp. BB11-1]MCY1036710.1 hypothetical protein [Corallococcus sp. BB11-1]
MTAFNAGRGWVRALAVTALLWGVTAAAQATPQVTVMTTVPVTGTAMDQVVASVVDTGVHRGGTLTVTLRILAASGAVLAQVTGPVSEGAPLRLSARAPSAAGVRAQLVLPMNRDPLGVGFLVLERWDPPSPPVEPPIACRIPRTGDPIGGTSEPTTGEPFKCVMEIRAP